MRTAFDGFPAAKEMSSLVERLGSSVPVDWRQMGAEEYYLSGLLPFVGLYFVRALVCKMHSELWKSSEEDDIQRSGNLGCSEKSLLLYRRVSITCETLVKLKIMIFI